MLRPRLNQRVPPHLGNMAAVWKRNHFFRRTGDPGSPILIQPVRTVHCQASHSFPWRWLHPTPSCLPMPLHSIKPSTTRTYTCQYQFTMFATARQPNPREPCAQKAAARDKRGHSHRAATISQVRPSLYPLSTGRTGRLCARPIHIDAKGPYHLANAVTQQGNCQVPSHVLGSRSPAGPGSASRVRCRRLA